MQTCQLRLRTVKCNDTFKFHLLIITKRRSVVLPRVKRASYTIGGTNRWIRLLAEQGTNPPLLAKQQAVHTIHPSFKKIKSLFSTSISSFSEVVLGNSSEPERKTLSVS